MAVFAFVDDDSEFGLCAAGAEFLDTERSEQAIFTFYTPFGCRDVFIGHIASHPDLIDLFAISGPGEGIADLSVGGEEQ